MTNICPSIAAPTQGAMTYSAAQQLTKQRESMEKVQKQMAKYNECVQKKHLSPSDLAALNKTGKNPCAKHLPSTARLY